MQIFFLKIFYRCAVSNTSFGGLSGANVPYVRSVLCNATAAPSAACVGGTIVTVFGRHFRNGTASAAIAFGRLNGNGSAVAPRCVPPRLPVWM